ncbi:conserved hypothetical protein [Ignisphaera aggregans DSM 17230]|uniref:Uncharacterized protein n=1 Tax=Ignisphaera aggregans (strain DSM 17230 / JCM 13409 / AQ1.S1) TaxID=583356 RepID=E0SSH0_IGNAA|nr:conserved hypothetical protein [Ignisphaera aggregans DSM 17230]
MSLPQFTPEFIASLASLASVVISISSLAYWLGKKFDEIDARFREIDRRFVEVEERLNRRIDEVERRLSERIDRVGLMVRRLGDAFIGYQEFFVRYLVSEGVLKSSAADMVLTEARNLVKLAVGNPFTKEEWKRLKELLDKSEKEKSLPLEEAYELLNLARKAVREYGEYPEAWKLHIYASIMVGLAYRKLREQEKKEEEKQTTQH